MPPGRSRDVRMIWVGSALDSHSNIARPAGRHFQNMSDSESPMSHVLGLRAGEWVEVRSAEEILATLDERGCLDALPFMPEMLEYCERRFRVIKAAHKTCDTIARYK